MNGLNFSEFGTKKPNKQTSRQIHTNNHHAKAWRAADEEEVEAAHPLILMKSFPSWNNKCSIKRKSRGSTFVQRAVVFFVVFLFHHFTGLIASRHLPNLKNSVQVYFSASCFSFFLSLFHLILPTNTPQDLHHSIRKPSSHLSINQRPRIMKRKTQSPIHRPARQLIQTPC